MVVHTIYSPDSFPSLREVIKESVSQGVVDAVHIFCQPPASRHPKLGEESAEEHIDELTQLREDLGASRIYIRGAAELGLLGPDADPMFLVGGDMFASLGWRRVVTGNRRPSICTLLNGHTLPKQPLSYMNIWAASACHDLLVTSCEAEANVVRKGIEQARAYVSHSSPEMRINCDPDIAQVPPGVNVDEFGILDPGACRKVLDLPSRAIVILDVGGASSRNAADVEVLYCAFRSLLDEDPNIVLLLTNNDDAHDRDADEFRRWLGLSNRVRLVPHAHGSAKSLLYSAADVVVSLGQDISTSVDHAVLEAMASGVPVVASDWGANREIVVHGQTGFLVPTFWNEPAASVLSWIIPALDDSSATVYLARRTILDVSKLVLYLRTLINNEDLRKDFGAASQALVARQFSWEHIVKKYKSLWETQAIKRSSHLSDNAPLLSFTCNALFQHYATRDMSFNMHVRASKNARSIVALPGPGEIPFHMDGIVGDFKSELLRVLDYCTETRTIKAILESGTDFSYEAVVWLLRKGFCELACA